MTITIYLTFHGNCDQAFNFYKSIFGCDHSYIGRYKDISSEARENFPFCKDEHIMHITLQINKETVLMGNDQILDEQNSIKAKNGFALLIHADTQSEADRIFNALSEEGEVILPIDKQFWGSYYGMCKDQFGVTWKISF